MAFNFEFNEEAAKSAGTGGGALPTGVYDFTVDTISESVASTGTVGYDFSLTINGAKVIIYGFWVQKADGTKIFNADTLMGLMGLHGIKKLTTFKKTIEVRAGSKEVDAVKEFEGLTGKIAIQRVLDWYNDAESEKNEIKAFFNTDGQTYAESINKSPGKQVEYFNNKLKDKETQNYKKAMADTSGPAAVVDDGASIL